MLATSIISTKSPVLVILPPTQRCPDLERVLKLARRAFDDLALNILDLNLRFAWVAGDELQKDDEPSSSPLPDDTPAATASWADHHEVNGSTGSATTQEHVSLALPFNSPAASFPPPAPAVTQCLPLAPGGAQNYATEQPPSAAAAHASLVSLTTPTIIQEADINCFRVFVSDLVPTLSDSDILKVCPPDTTINGATFYQPLPLGANGTMVRSATFAFQRARQAKEFHAWVKEAGNRLLDRVFVVPSVTVYFLPRGMAPEELMPEGKRVAFLNQDGESDPAVTSQDQPANPVSPSPTRPAHLPEAHDSYWRLIVRNVIGSLSKSEILASIVPRHCILAGATIRFPKALGSNGRGHTEQTPQGRDVKLAFHSEADAIACRAWILKRSNPGGLVAKVIVPTFRISISRPLPPIVSAPSSTCDSTSDNVASTSTPSISSLSTLISSLSSDFSSFGSPLNHLSPSSSPPHPPTPRFQLTVGNLLHHLKSDELFAALVPPGVIPTDMSIQPLQQLSGRSEQCRSIVFDFDSEHDLQATHDWIRSEAVAGGRVAKLLPPNVRVAVTMSKLPLGPVPPPTSSSSFANLPDTSPDHFRLHVSNLRPDLDLARILPMLVPQDMTIAGATLLAPHAMGGYRRELVRSLELAFVTEADAKRCREWIKQDLGGCVAKVALSGIRLDIGKLQEPHVSLDPQPEASVELVDNACGSDPPSPSLSRRRDDSQALPTAAELAASTTSAKTSAKQFHISISGIDPSTPASTVFSTILGSLPSSVEPDKMGIRDVDGRLRVEFVFDAEAVVKQFVLQVWMAIKAGTLASITADGCELRIGRGSCGGENRE